MMTLSPSVPDRTLNMFDETAQLSEEGVGLKTAVHAFVGNSQYLSVLLLSCPKTSASPYGIYLRVGVF